MNQSGDRKIPVRSIPVILWMLVIFFFSSMPDQISDKQSDYVAIRLQRIFSPEETTEDMEDSWTDVEYYGDFPVRKTAHVLEFLILGVFLYVALYGKRNRSGLTLLFGTIYAVSDEVHQLFVYGRACELTDMLIDSAGVVISVLLMFLIGDWIDHIVSKGTGE